MSNEPDYFDPTSGGEPYHLEEDQGWGQCAVCGSYLENWGAHSDGDGDLYDLLGCPLCQEERSRANERWFNNEGEEFDTEEDMWVSDMYGDGKEFDDFYPPEDDPNNLTPPLDLDDIPF